MATYSALRTKLLQMLRDPDAQKWSSSDEIYFLLSNAERWLARRIGGYSKSGRFKYADTVALPANTETYALSSLTKEFVAVRYIDILTNAAVRQPVDPIAEGDENLYRANSMLGWDLVPGYFIRNDALVFLPTSGAARTLYVSYQWIPAVKTSGSDTTETPTEYDDMLLARAAFDAMSREGESDSKLEEKYAARLDEIERYEYSRLDRGGSETVKNLSGRVLFG